MSAPIPSFFKIRLVILIICFILGCFLIGSVRNVFAAFCNDGTCYTAKITAYGYYTGNYAHPYRWSINDGCPPSITNDSVTFWPGSTHTWTVTVKLYYWDTVSLSWVVHPTFYYNTIETSVSDLDSYMSFFNLGGSTSDDPSWVGVDGRNLYPNGCPSSPCQTEKDLLSQQCGGEGTYFINEGTCEGYCTVLPEQDKNKNFGPPPPTCN